MPFPVVGVGASAGGLESFEKFIRRLPAGTGMAFVLVSHLDPSHESILAEILRRGTSVPVLEVTDGMQVKPNCIFVIPANRDLTISQGKLRLRSPALPRGQRMPIDAFLRSLADDQAERAVGVVLSGTGTDGTLGLRDILGAGGMTFVQDPASATYDGMPSSAIHAGYAQHVLPPEEMPEAILAATRRPMMHAGQPLSPDSALGLTQILATVRSRSGRDFSLYKKSTIVRRLVRRMAQHGIERMEVYARYLAEHPDEVQALVRELLINVTSFFRSPEAFDVLRKEVLPRLIADRPPGSAFRAWVAGCATGEEAFSIAILLREMMAESNHPLEVQIYATDVDEEAIAAARAGVYLPSIVQDVSPDRLTRYFVKEEAGFRVRKEVREMVVFAVQDVIKDPPFTRIDLLSCRNLMIYMEPELQNSLLARFHYALRPGGALLLSPSESTGTHSDLFRPLDRKWKIYEAVPHPASGVLQAAGAGGLAERIRLRDEPKAMDPVARTSLAEVSARALLQSFAPPSVVTDRQGSVLYVHGDTGSFLRPAPGIASLNLVDLARPGLQAELRAALHTAVTGRVAVRGRRVQMREKGKSRTIALSIVPIGAAGDASGNLLVSFEDLPAEAPSTRGRPASKGKVEGGTQTRELKRALAAAQELLRTTAEEQQASGEELRSMNEELQSTNEELQSTNEELETSKEELQSVNEELVTVNGELQAKVDQMSSMQNDMRNLLDNVAVGVIFLDEDLAIRRFTREATRIFRLVPTDVGRPLADIKGDAAGDPLLAGARLVLENLIPWEREMTTASGASYLARIQPYRTLDNVIDGVVLTFTDISTRKEEEEKVEHARQTAQDIIDTVREPLLVLDGDLKVRSASQAFFRRFQVKPEETLGRVIFDLGDRQWEIPALRELLAAVVREGRSFDDFVVEHDFPGLGHQRFELNARRIAGSAPDGGVILLAFGESREGQGPRVPSGSTQDESSRIFIPGGNS